MVRGRNSGIEENGRLYLTEKDDALNKCNYRLVTVLVTVGKVFEKLLAGQLELLSIRAFEGLNSTYHKRYRRYSCETTLVRLVEDWKRSLDNNHTVGVLFTDMSKAYFTNRKNRVRLSNTCNEWKAVKRGCPQGSSLGPVLWNFYQNDLFYENIRSQLNAYADDDCNCIFRVRRLTTSSAVLWRTEIQLLAGINPTTSRE